MFVLCASLLEFTTIVVLLNEEGLSPRKKRCAPIPAVSFSGKLVAFSNKNRIEQCLALSSLRFRWCP